MKQPEKIPTRNTPKAKCINIHVAALLLLLLLTTACEKENNEALPPQIKLSGEQFITGDTAFRAGDEMNFRVELTATEYDITLFYIQVTTDSTTTWFDTGMHSRQVTWQGSFIKGLSKEERWTFLARDRYGNESSTGLLVRLDTTGGFGELAIHENIRMGAQSNPELGGILDIGTESVWFFGEVSADEQLQAEVDMIYYLGEDQHTIASPGANVEPGVFPGSFSDWPVINTTRYMEAGLTEEEFRSLSNDSLLVARYNEGEAKRKAKNLAAGDNYLFRNQAGKLGVFFVNNVTGMEEGYVEIDVRIQP